MPDFTEEIFQAFRHYCAERVAPVISPGAMRHIKHCLTEAALHAELAGEEVDIGHHPLFALIALECGHPELINEFLIALTRTSVSGQAACCCCKEAPPSEE